MTKMRNKAVSLILCLAMISAYTFFIPKAQAQWVVTDPGNTFQSAISAIWDVAKVAFDYAEKALAVLGANTVVTYKIIALLAVQKSVAYLVGDNGDGGLIIRDYNSYLYTAPRQQALTQVNTFLNKVNKGRASLYNYEGVGPNYHGYLAEKGKGSVANKRMETNIQEQVTDPKQMFSEGNMKGIMSYMQCANNATCIALATASEYNQNATKIQDLARSEQQNGFIPKKGENGLIETPAMLAQNALMEVDKQGMELIMTAEAGDNGSQTSAAIQQIAEGSILSIASRVANYGISDKTGTLPPQNNEYAFSLSYNGSLVGNSSNTTSNVNQSSNPNFR